MNIAVKLDSGHYWFIAVAVVISVFALPGETLTNDLAYHRDWLAEGEFWRILSGHLVHSNHWHLLLNLSSLALIGTLFGSLLTAGQWAKAFTFCGLVVSACYYFIAPEYTSYVGLSAVLYGVIIVGALKDLKQHTLIAIALLVIVTGRVIWQQFDGASTELADLVENRVAIESHVFGLVGGYLYALLSWTWHKVAASPR